MPCMYDIFHISQTSRTEREAGELKEQLNIANEDLISHNDNNNINDNNDDDNNNNNNNNNNNYNNNLYFTRITQSNTGLDFCCGPQI